jgi:cell division topological specificity factor
MFDFFKSFFRPEKPSSTTAKERLRLVLLSDHISLSPEIIESLKADLLAVISRYVEIDSGSADVTFEHRENEIAMLASVPIKGLREGRPEPPPRGGQSRPQAAVTGAPPAVEAAAAEPATAEPAAAGAEPQPVALAEAEPESQGAVLAEAEAEAEPEAQAEVLAVAEPPPAKAAAVFADADSQAGLSFVPAVTGKAARRRRRRKAARAAMLQPKLGGQALGAPAQA